MNSNITSGNYGFGSANGNGASGNGNGFSWSGKSNSMNGFVGDSLADGNAKVTGGNGTGNIVNGWYDMYTYQNSGNGYFLPNSMWMNQATDFGTLGTTSTYQLVDGKWVITHEGDSWINKLPSAGGKQMVGDAQ